MYGAKDKIFETNTLEIQSKGSYQYGSASSDTNPYAYLDHVVKEGETLGDLAKRYGVSKEEIIKANSGEGGAWHRYDRSKEWLYTGEKLIIPITDPKILQIEQIKQWIEQQQSIPSENDHPVRKSTPNVQRSNPYKIQRPLKLDYSKLKHHGGEKLFPDIPYNVDVWHKAGTIKEFTPEELKDVEVYIFYVSDFSSQSGKLIRDAVELYGENKVATGYMQDAQTFSALWRQMDGDPATVIVNTHGKNQSITTGHGEGDQQLTATGDGKTNISGTKVTNIQDLPKPKADFSRTELQLNSCHSYDTNPNPHLEGDHHQGALKGSKKTAAEVFLREFRFNRVRGTEGAVNYIGYHNTGWWWGIDDSWEVGDPYPEDGTWRFISIDEEGNLNVETREIE